VSPIVLRLRELRKAKGWSQAALAKRAGVYQATISELETGRSRSISFAVLDQVAAALGVEPGELLDRVPTQRRAIALPRRRR